MENTQITVPKVTIKQGAVNFPAYLEIKEQAQAIAEHVRETIVTEENVKETKKMVAAVRKAVNGLEDQRIAIKKEMMEPYFDFEAKVKEITGIVSDAESVVRVQIKALEEMHRDNKKVQIEELFIKRLKMYDLPFLEPSDFITPTHLGKSMTMKKIEEEMVTFLEQTHSQVKAIGEMKDSDEVMEEYIIVRDMGKAIDNVKLRKQARVQAEEIAQRAKEQPMTEAPKRFCLVIDEKDRRLVELLLKDEGVIYEIAEI